MSPVTKENVQILVDLQKRDSALDKLNARLKKIPEEIQDWVQEFEEQKSSLEGIRGESKKLQLEQRKKEVDLAAKEEEIKKHERELNAIKTNEAFKALQKEIETGKEEKDKLEEEILLLLDKTDQGLKRQKEEGKQLEERATVLESRKKELGVEADRLKEEVQKKVLERDRIAAQAPPDMLKRYQHIRSRKSGRAMVAVQNETCGGCNMKLTPQTRIDVQKGNLIVLCEGCQRMLYLPTDAAG